MGGTVLSRNAASNALRRVAEARAESVSDSQIA